ncbi:MAG: hypothetical protein Q8N63_07150, partial [Nanoarchaeota archaeon]|nr:hypothetical protein [Nanoarchaeota archaeon]
MKKGKTKKIAVKRKIQKIKTGKKTSSQIKKDLELFAKGVERLKELENELNSLDTRGFYKEEQAIKSKLKNVSDISVIERELKDLRSKINRKYKPKQKRKNQYKSIAGEIEKLKEEIKRKKPSLYGVKKEIKELKEEVERKKPSLYGVKKEMREVKETVPKIEKELRELAEKIGKKKPESCVRFKEELKEIKERIPKIEGGMKDVKGIKEEVPKIEREIEKLSRKFGVGHVKIDSGVGVLVDAKFNNFLNEVKSALSERVKEREKEVDDILRGDLQEREDKFRDRYEELVREFNDGKRKIEKEFNKKYKNKVKIELHKEISEKFNDKLIKRLNAEKVELGEKYKEQLREHA